MAADDVREPFHDLLMIGSGQSLARNYGEFLTTNIRKIGAGLRHTETHRHNGQVVASAADAPNDPTVALASEDGGIAAGVTVEYRVARVDALGVESAASDVVSFDTPEAIDTPDPVTLSRIATGGALNPGLYEYAVSVWTGFHTYETLADNEVGAHLPPSDGDEQQIVITLPELPAGADGFNVYRRLPGSVTYNLLATLADTYAENDFTDDGGTDADAERVRPTINSSNGANAIEITPDGTLDTGEAWRIYRRFDEEGTDDDLDWAMTLLDDLEEGGDPSYIDLGGAPQAGAPLASAASFQNPGAIDLAATGADKEVTGILPSLHGGGARGTLDVTLTETTRQVTDAVTNTDTSLTSATAAFVAADVGAVVAGTGIVEGTRIASVTNGTTVVLDTATTATDTDVTVDITKDQADLEDVVDTDGPYAVHVIDTDDPLDVLLPDPETSTELRIIFKSATLTPAEITWLSTSGITVTDPLPELLEPDAAEFMAVAAVPDDDGSRWILQGQYPIATGGGSGGYGSALAYVEAPVDTKTVMDLAVAPVAYVDDTVADGGGTSEPCIEFPDPADHPGELCAVVSAPGALSMGAWWKTTDPTTGYASLGDMFSQILALTGEGGSIDLTNATLGYGWNVRVLVDGVETTSADLDDVYGPITSGDGYAELIRLLSDIIGVFATAGADMTYSNLGSVGSPTTGAGSTIGFHSGQGELPCPLGDFDIYDWTINTPGVIYDGKDGMIVGMAAGVHGALGANKYYTLADYDVIGGGTHLHENTASDAHRSWVFMSVPVATPYGAGSIDYSQWPDDTLPTHTWLPYGNSAMRDGDILNSWSNGSGQDTLSDVFQALYSSLGAPESRRMLQAYHDGTKLFWTHVPIGGLRSLSIAGIGYTLDNNEDVYVRATETDLAYNLPSLDDTMDGRSFTIFHDSGDGGIVTVYGIWADENGTINGVDNYPHVVIPDGHKATFTKLNGTSWLCEFDRPVTYEAEHALSTAVAAAAADPYFSMVDAYPATNGAFAWSTPTPASHFTTGAKIRAKVRPKEPLNYSFSDGDMFWAELFSAPTDNGQGGLDVVEAALTFAWRADVGRWQVNTFWEHTQAADVRTVTDLVTNGTTTITSATANFTAADEAGNVYIVIDGDVGTYTIQSVVSATEVVVSNAAGTGTGQTAIIGHEHNDLSLTDGFNNAVPWDIPIDGVVEILWDLDFDDGDGGSSLTIYRRVYIEKPDLVTDDGAGWKAVARHTSDSTTDIAMTHASTWYIGYSTPSHDLLELTVMDGDGTVRAAPSPRDAIDAAGLEPYGIYDAQGNHWVPGAEASAVDPNPEPEVRQNGGGITLDPTVHSFIVQRLAAETLTLPNPVVSHGAEFTIANRSGGSISVDSDPFVFPNATIVNGDATVNINEDFADTLWATATPGVSGDAGIPGATTVSSVTTGTQFEMSASATADATFDLEVEGLVDGTTAAYSIADGDTARFVCAGSMGWIAVPL